MNASINIPYKRIATNIFQGKIKIVFQTFQFFGNCRRFSSNAIPERTALYDLHVKLGGKIVNFGGFALPVQYADQSIKASHLFTRQNASIFDVSHMLQTYVSGKDAISCIESVCTADIQGAANGSGSLTVFTNPQGGILDDLIVTRIHDKQLYIVSNAAMKKQDMSIMEAAVSNFEKQGKDVAIEFLSCQQQSLIAVQGPKAVSTLARLVPTSDRAKLDHLYFMTTMTAEVAGVCNCRITRCGYTGEDGVEISVPSEKVCQVTEALLASGGGNKDETHICMAGLGARDSLRLEAGMCLYGSDIDAQTTPIEAALAWLVAKRRRSELNFPGAQIISKQLKEGVRRRRIGIQMTGVNVPAARAGAKILFNGEVVGQITSGCLSPTILKNIAMGYISEDLKNAGTKIQLQVRNKLYDAVVTRMPFINTKYFTKPRK